MSFAKEIGLIDELEKKFSHLKKRKRGYCVSEKILSFLHMLIKGKWEKLRDSVTEEEVAESVNFYRKRGDA